MTGDFRHFTVIDSLHDYDKILNLTAHYRHREIASITGNLLAEKESILAAQKEVEKTLKEKENVAEGEKVYEVEVPDEVADILTDYEVILDKEGNPVDATKETEKEASTVKEVPVVKEERVNGGAVPYEIARKIKFVKKIKKRR